MKRVVGISLGSPARDFRAIVEWGGVRVGLERRGSGGDLHLAARWLAGEDGRATALGLGGINLFLGRGSRRYPFAQAQRLAGMVRESPLVDGGGVKEHWEPWLVQRLAEQNLIRTGDTALAVSALDRWAQAEELHRAGCRLLIGDAASAFGLPIYFHSLGGFSLAADVAMPFFRRLPIGMLYPLGRREGGGARLVRRPTVDVLAGDFRFLRRFLAPPPPRLVITSTLAGEDVQELRRAGIQWLATLSPLLQGRSLGANMLEAWLVAVREKKPEALGKDDYLAPLQEGFILPRLERLND